MSLAERKALFAFMGIDTQAREVDGRVELLLSDEGAALLAELVPEAGQRAALMSLTAEHGAVEALRQVRVPRQRL